MLFDTDRYPVMENTPYSKWNGCIRLDIDLDEEHTGLVLNEDDINKIYDVTKLVLKNHFSHNWLYIEHSSSGKGIHIIFYYDIDNKDEITFKSCAEYTKSTFINSVKTYSERLFNILQNNNVFDAIYRKLYQKTYLTKKDYQINDNCTGFIIEETISNFIKQQEQRIELERQRQAKYKPGQYEIISSSDKEFTEIYDHNQRFKIATALKAVTSSKEQWQEEHEKICRRYKLYKQYTYSDFVKAFSYESLDPSRIDVNILERLGINVDKTKWAKTLKPDEYLGSVLPEILSNIENGCNLLIAPTGSGKTVSWINYHKEICSKIGDLDNLFNLTNEKPIMIIEPLNSIIETKYDSKRCKIIKGNTNFPEIITQYDLYITNYNHLVEKFGEGYRPRQDLQQLVRQFRFIVIDESQLIIKDCFRNDLLQEFTNAINSITDVPVILQTATPMDEDRLFDIKKKFIVKKPLNKNIKYIFRYVDDRKFEFSQLECLINYYRTTGRKVYVYWTNGSIQKMKIVFDLFKDKAAIFHKRYSYFENHEDMDYIKEKHELGDKYDLLVSSMYFGVGNDLNDNGKAAVIIIGNNTWQEDIQAIGRFRNSDDIEVCQIVLPFEKEEIENQLKEDYLNYELAYSKHKNYLNNLLIDRYNKPKSLIIKYTDFKLTKLSNLHIYTIMSLSAIYHSNMKLKLDKFREYGIDVRPVFDRPVLTNEDFHEKTLSYNREIKKIREGRFAGVINGTVKYDNTDTRIQQFKYIWDSAKKYGFTEIIGPDKIKLITNFDRLKMYIMYFKELEKQNMEYSELYSYILVRSKILGLSGEERSEELKIGNTEEVITREDYYIAIGYAIFCKFKNKETEFNSRVFNSYFKKYRRYAKYWIDFDDAAIDYLFQKNHKTTEINLFKSELGNYFSIGDFQEMESITNYTDLLKLITENIGINLEDYLIMCIKASKKGISEKLERSDKGKEHKKHKKHKKRKLEKIMIEGKIYKSREDAAKKLGKSMSWIYKNAQKLDE